MARAETFAILEQARGEGPVLLEGEQILGNIELCKRPDVNNGEYVT